LLIATSTLLPVFAQQTVKDGKNTIEFIGLQKWTVQRLQDSVRKYAPKVSLAFCAATLKSEFGFRGASVVWHSDSTLAVTVIEPQDSSYVRYHHCFAGGVGLPRKWYDFQTRYSQKHYESQIAVACRFESDDSTRKLSEAYRRYSIKVDTVALQEIRTALKEYPIEVSQLAQVIRNHYDMWSRRTAIMALTGAPNNDTALTSVVFALRSVGDVDLSALPLILKHRTKPIVIAPMIDDLQAIVNGTNLFAYPEVLKLLTQAKLSQQEFKQIFNTAHSRRLLLSHLRAALDGVRKPAQELMNMVNPAFARMPSTEQEQFVQKM
jgi:hypothetical protein